MKWKRLAEYLTPTWFISYKTNDDQMAQNSLRMFIKICKYTKKKFPPLVGKINIKQKQNLSRGINMHTRLCFQATYQCSHTN